MGKPIINTLVQRIGFLLVISVLINACKKKDIIGSVPPSPSPTSGVALKIVSSDYMHGNNAKGIKDTIYLRFNKAVQFKYFYSVKDPCYPDFKFTTADSGRLVKCYEILCGRIGGEYAFAYSAIDLQTGKILTDTIRFNCYTRKIPVTGRVSNYLISDDNKFCWVLTQSPNTLCCFGLEDTTYKKVYGLDFVPNLIVLNPFNQQFYITVYSTDFAHKKNLYVIKPSDGTVSKTIQLTWPSPGVVLYPSEVAFGKNGYGIVAATNQFYSPTWLVIDSKQNDTTYRHPSSGPNGFPNPRLDELRCLATNFDRTKVIGLQHSGSRLGVLDCETKTISEMSHALSAQFNTAFITANKKRDAIFFGNAPGSQFLVSNGVLTGSITGFSGLAGSADFSYRANEPAYVYYLGDDYAIHVINLANGDHLMEGGFWPDLTQIKSTTDGKYLLAKGTDCIQVFDLGIFYKYL